MAFDLAFVDSIASSPVYRLNLNSGNPLSVMADGSSFGMPALRRARASSILVDGDYISAASYGNRLIRLRIELPHLDKDLAATQLQLLAREINREANFLRYRPGTSEPVFFRTFRSEIADVQWDGVSTFGEVEVEAEPFAFGLPVTLSAVTVTNNPAAVSNGMFWDVTDVLGDVEAATQVIDTANAMYNSSLWLATRRRGTPADVPFFAQAEAMTQVADTATQPNDAAMSGSGNNYSRVTFATTPSMATRLYRTFPFASTIDARGTYRVIACVRQSSGGDLMALRVILTSLISSDTAFLGEVVNAVQTTSRQHVDLGLISAPFGVDPVTDGPSGVQLPAAPFNMSISAQRVSGAGTLDIDYILFLPADDQHAPVQIGNDGSGKYVFDAYQDVVYSLTSGAVDLTQDIIPGGGTPSVLPGVTNRIYLVRGKTNVSVTATVPMQVKYWPRYFYARPVGS